MISRIRNWLARVFAKDMNLDAIIDHSMLPSSGTRVNRQTILTYAPIWYSTCKISGHIGLMPKKVERHRGEEVEELTSVITGLCDLLNHRANPLMSSLDMVETVQKDAIIDGNGRVAILRRGGEPVALYPIHPKDAWCFLSYPDTENQITISDTHPYGTALTSRRKWHHVTTANGETFILPDEDVIHVKGLQHDGLVGIPLWYVARESVGGALAGQEYVNRTTQNNGIPGLILEAPAGVLTDDGKAKEFIDTFREYHEGTENANKTALLRYGVSAKQLSQTGRESQMLESRKFSRDEAWLWTGDILLYDGGSAYANQQERDEAYKQHTLSRWLSKWEAECNAKLITAGQRARGWRINFAEDAILRGSPDTRAEFYEVARRIGLLSQEEIRRKEGLPPPDPNENFDNPNTTPGGEEEAEPSQVDSEPAGLIEQENPEDVRRRKITNRIGKEMKRERYRLLEAARNPETFLTVAERFYNKHHREVAELCVKLDCEPWTHESWMLVLMVSECQPDQLAGKIEELTRRWPTDRAREIAFAAEVLP